MFLNHISGSYFPSSYLKTWCPEAGRAICLFSHFILFHIMGSIELGSAVCFMRCPFSHTFTIQWTKPASPKYSVCFSQHALGFLSHINRVKKFSLGNSYPWTWTLRFGNLVWLHSLNCHLFHSCNRLTKAGYLLFLKLFLVMATLAKCFESSHEIVNWSIF